MEYGAAIVIGELTSLELKEPAAAAAAIYDQPIGLRLLHEEPNGGEEHYLVRYPAGLRGRPHLHTAAHTIVVLEGNSTRTATSSAPVLTRTSPRGR